MARKKANLVESAEAAVAEAAMWTSALRESGGQIAKACRILGRNAADYRRFRKANPKLVESLDDEISEFHETLLDEAEEQLLEAARDGKRWAVETIMRELGHLHGFGQKDAKPKASDQIVGWHLTLVTEEKVGIDEKKSGAKVIDIGGN